MYFCVKDTKHANQERFYLVTVQGSRRHGLTGFKGGVVRSVVFPRMRGSTEKALLAMKQKLEQSKYE